MRARLILVVVGIGMILYGYPGLMGADSADQLVEARSWDFGDWHPPLMSLLWRFTEVFIAGPFGMFLVQVAGFVLGVYAILQTEIASPRAAVATLALAWFPPVLWVMGVVWKDAQMAAFALVGIAALMSPRPRMRWLAIAALLVASAMRHNAAALTFAPLVLLWGRAQGKQGWRAPLAGLGVWVAVTILPVGIDALLVRKHQHPWVNSIAITDVVGTIRWAPPLTDDELRPMLAEVPLVITGEFQKAFTEHYTELGWLDFIYVDPPIGLPGNDAERAGLTRAWRTLVTTYPAAYLKFRWRVFRKLIRFGEPLELRPRMWTGFIFKRDPELTKMISHDASKSGVQRLLFRLARSSVFAVFNVPYVYLLIAFAFVPLAWRSRRALALLLSGIAYELALFFVAPSDDLRYSHWLIVTTLLAGTLLFAARWRRGRAA